MTELQWGQAGSKQFETGVSKGVLYRRDGAGQYNIPSAWNGLTAVNESPSGAESNKQYADNVEYANLLSAEQYAATIEAFTYPSDFEYCDGTASLAPGITVGQQKRETFGFSYQTIVGTDLDPEAGYKIHVVYGATAAPSEKNHATVNDSPELAAFSWELSTTPVPVPGFRPSATLTIDSTKTAADDLAALEALLYGTAGSNARLPLPAEIISLVGAATEVLPVAPTYNGATDTITIPATTGVQYQIDGQDVAAGPIVITKDTIVTAVPMSGYKFPAVSDTDWFFDWS